MAETAGFGSQVSGAEAKAKSRLTRRSVLIGAGVVGAGAIGAAGFKLAKPGGAIGPQISRARPIPSDTQFPKSVDVVVIGGGNIGTATALDLAERGVSVALFEKGLVAGEQSGRSFGLVESLAIDPIKMELFGHSKEMWKNMNARTGQQTGYVRNGLLAVLGSEEEEGFFKGWMEQVRDLPGHDARIINRSEVDSLFPGIASTRIGGVFQPSDGQAEPQLAAPAFALGARAKGAKIFQGCAVRGIDRTGGRISGVFTERGRVACQAVVLAGGSWTSLFLRSLNIDIPQFEVGSSSASVIAPNIAKVPTIVNGAGLRTMWNGRISIGASYSPVPIVPDMIRYLPQLLPMMDEVLTEAYPVFSASTFWEKLTTPTHWDMDEQSPFERRRVLVSEAPAEIWGHSLNALREAVPAFKQAKVMETWGGFMSVMLDNAPIIDRIQTIPGMYMASGCNFGLAMAPAIGQALADLVTNQRPKIDLKPYRFSRFSDGSAIQFRA